MDTDSEEHIIEVAKVLSEYCDLIAIRAFPKFINLEEDLSDNVINSFAKHATVPVVNMETITHPCQELLARMSNSFHINYWNSCMLCKTVNNII